VLQGGKLSQVLVQVRQFAAVSVLLAGARRVKNLVKEIGKTSAAQRPRPTPVAPTPITLANRRFRCDGRRTIAARPQNG
jgi:hypothetical protein